MIHNIIRKDKTCLNCGYHVEERFCPKCGQENIEPRQSFYYLFSHFIQDLIHYDDQFWKTIKYLIFSPGKLTTEYLSGKRKQYVSPVKLYIFISFITFFAVVFFNTDDSLEDRKPISDNSAITLLNDSVKDSHIEENTNNVTLSLTGKEDSIYIRFNNLEQFDSAYQIPHPIFYRIAHPIINKFYLLKSRGVSPKEILTNFRLSFYHNLPKAIFLYLPFFALLMWMFHDKKQWWYFEHGIFTLHYFSFLLIVVFLIMTVSYINMSLVRNNNLKPILSWISLIIYAYLAIYFFFAHHRIYKTTKKRTVQTGILIFLINSIFFFCILLALLYYSFIMIH